MRQRLRRMEPGLARGDGEGGAGADRGTGPVDVGDDAEVGPRVDLALRRAEDLLARTDRVVAALDSARPALARAPVEAAATLAESRALLADVRAGLAQGGGVDEVMRNLAAAGENLSRLSARLERDPLSALRSRQNPPKPAGPGLR